MALTFIGNPQPPKDIMRDLRNKLPQIKQSCQELRAKYTGGLREDDIEYESTIGYVNITYQTYIDLVETYHWIAEVNSDEKLAKVRRYVNHNQMHRLKDLVDKGEI